MAMSEPEVEWLGNSCGKHGSYTFYKGFKLIANGETKKYLLGEFYFVRNSKDRPICIAELQLVWHDANTGNQLASARLYFRPEAIPGGRQNCHGKDELLYTDEKVVIKCKDMINLECDAREWCYGMKALSELNLQEVDAPNNDNNYSNKETTKKYRLCKNILKKEQKMLKKERAKIVILSFPAYCRYQSLLKKLSNGLVLSKMAIIAFGGIIRDNDDTWISFSRDSFHHPELDKFNFFNDNKAPVLKGRPRKRRAKSSTAKGQGRGKQRRTADADTPDNLVGRRPSPASDSSDDNQTDTSEGSLFGGQELPRPPKLVSALKEERVALAEVRQGVIHTVKPSNNDVKTTLIPPVPKLVKIETKQSEVFHHAKKPADEAGSRSQSIPQPTCCVENKITLSSTKTSVISSAHNRGGVHIRSVYPPITQQPSPIVTNKSRVTQPTCNTPAVASLTSCEAAHVSVSSSQATFVSHSETVTTHQNIHPKVSAVVSAAQAIALNSQPTSLPSKLGTEQRLECRNDLKQVVKRKRGRPPGKSKYLRVEEVKSGETKPKDVYQERVKPATAQVKIEPKATQQVETNIKIECRDTSESEDASERDFMRVLKNYMKKRGSPIEKIPALGFRKINLFKMFEVTNSLGGYDVVTANRMWRRVYDEVGGVPSITSAATNSRKHYERLLLPYERFRRGQDLAKTVKKSEAPTVKQETEITPATQKDQNANVVAKKDLVVIAQNVPQKSTKPAVSAVKPQEPPDKPSKPAVSERILSTPSDVLTSSVEFITTGSRGSPVLLYSSSVDQPPRRHTSSKEIPRSSPCMRYESRPRVITSVDRKRLNNEQFRSSAPEPVRNEMKSFIMNMAGDDSRTYTSQKCRNNDLKTSVADLERSELRTSGVVFESKHDYVSRHVSLDHANDSRSRVSENRHTVIDSHAYLRTKNNTPDISPESRDIHKNKVVCDPGDGVLMMNLDTVDEKIHSSSRGHSPRPRDDPLFSTFSVPVFQSPHFSHGVEVYDLPNGGFPLRTSSRIFMPSTHQVFPGPSHPAAATISPYPPHFITAVGPEHGAVYQLPISGFYPPELPYPLDGVQILHS